jgi:hypothetical protein
MFIKKVFLYFEPICADLASKFAKRVLNANKTPKKLFWKKDELLSKSAEFYADFKTVEKVAKKFMHKKLLTKM